MPAALEKSSVLFVCVANSFRSQMAEAIAKSVGGGQWDVWSAGSSPSGRVHPLAMQLLGEIGLDVTHHRSKGVDEVPPKQWDYVVTMGCGDACPSVSAHRRIDWDIPDPAGLPLDDARKIRDQIGVLVRALLQPRPHGPGLDKRRRDRRR